ncbi:MAG: ATP-binding protein [Phycisphaerales bacterium]|nr:ATP-binding protein [Phycisphaerales bacterium]
MPILQKDQSSSHIRRSITRFRWLTLGIVTLVAVLSTAMIYNITASLDDSAAAKINLAASHRALAQRILTNALQIDTGARTAQWDELEPAFTELNKTISQLRIAHSELTNDSHMNSTVESEFANQERELFMAAELPFNKMLSASEDLSKLTISMIRRSPYIDSQTLERVTSAKNVINDAHRIFLPKMKEIVSLNEVAYTSEIRSSIRNAKVGIFIIITVLICAVLFVVEPTILIIRRQLHELDRATRHAKRADAIRWRLLNNMGHEFRTPMNAIMGFASLLNEDTLSDSERSQLSSSIHDSSKELNKLIESMLDLSAIESGQLSVVNSECSIHNIITQIKIATASSIHSKNLELDVIFDSSCPDQVTTDPKRLEQILINLVDNAIKFTDKGKVTIEARSLNNDSKELIEIKVTDTGIGIPENKLKAIFDPFTQAQDNLTRNFGGAGLGLAVSRDLAKALGGNVTVKSTVQMGSTFTLTVNANSKKTFTTQHQSVEQQKKTPSLENRKILIVDDAKDNRVLLQLILKRSGAATEFAHDGQQAINAVNNAITDDSPYDLILMDMQMPVLDGYHATVQLREQGLKTPIIAVTAHALEGDREHCLNAGCDEYMSKPVNKALLIETCIDLIENSKSKSNPKQIAA